MLWCPTTGASATVGGNLRGEEPADVVDGVTRRKAIACSTTAMRQPRVLSLSRTPRSHRWAWRKASLWLFGLGAGRPWARCQAAICSASPWTSRDGPGEEG